VAFLDISFYGLDDKRYHEIVTELERRHNEEKEQTGEAVLSASTL
jgi:GPH family glycoside/pentoside/hexuronide:cation symporter